MATSDESNKTLNIDDTLDRAAVLLDEGKPGQALLVCGEVKATDPTNDEADLLRARSFLAMEDRLGARQALLEALRHRPINPEAHALLESLSGGAGTGVPVDPLIEQVSTDSMLGPARLGNLIRLIERVALEQVPGVIVECGVAGGGSLALLALAARRSGLMDRTVFGFDSFCGMPEPGEDDRAGDRTPSEMGWGTGTCAAPRSSVVDLLNRLGVGKSVRVVRGLFEDTLPEFASDLKRKGERIALLHCDGDWMTSTHAILSNFFPLVSPGAYVQIDDYGHWNGCRRAVDEYFATQDQPIDLHEIDYAGRWMRKQP